MVRVSIILPVYNEYRNLKNNFPKIYSAAKKLGSFEIIIAEDGSNDGSTEISRKFSRLPGVRVMHRDYKSGKGGAIKRSLSSAHGNVVGYMDIDLAVPVSYVGMAVEKVEEGNRIVIGSRYANGSETKRSPVRHFLSFGYNGLIFLLFGSRVRDHQCGFKFMDRNFAKKFATPVRDNYWFFDAEMLIRAERAAIIPYELPVKWDEQRETKLRPKDVALFMLAMLKFRFSPA